MGEGKRIQIWAPDENTGKACRVTSSPHAHLAERLTEEKGFDPAKQDKVSCFLLWN